MVKINSVIPESPAFRHGIVSGDILDKINGHNVKDVLDYMYYAADTSIDLVIIRDGESMDIHIEKDEYDDLGLEFETFLMDNKQSCSNKCVFCFIDQMPKGMRETLYFKDDDARLSFLQGNYVTLTNLKQSDIDRIIEREKDRLQDNLENARMSHGGETTDSKKKPKRNETPKVGRNDPCPCGSGKKYKNCCGR